MKKTAYIILIFVIFLCSNLSAREFAGEITRIQGRVEITSPGMEPRPAALKDKIQINDIVTTKSSSKAEVTFTDKSIIRFAPSTRMKIEEFTVKDEKTDGLFHLFRGKIQSIIKKGFWSGHKTKVEVKTKTAVVGVRGTDFFTYFQNNESGAFFNKGFGYVFSLNRPEKVLDIRAGQVMQLNDPFQVPLIRPATAFEINRHIKDTGITRESGEKGRLTDNSKQNKAGIDAQIKKDMPVEQVIADALKSRDQFEPEKFEYVINIQPDDNDEQNTWFYNIDIGSDGNAGINFPATNSFISITQAAGISPENIQAYLNKDRHLYVGNIPGYFNNGTSTGGAIYASPVVNEETRLQDNPWSISSLQYAGTYEEFSGATFDQWDMSMNYLEADTRHFYNYSGSKWSSGEIEGKGVSAWINLNSLVTGIGGGEISGTYDPAEKTWQGSGRWVSMNTDLFNQMRTDRAEQLNSLGIPSIELGRATLKGSGNNMEITMNDVTFFSYSTGNTPRIWTANDISGTYSADPVQGMPVSLSGSGLNAEFGINRWTRNQWSAQINNGTGVLTQTNGQTRSISFNGGAAGTFNNIDSSAGIGTFSGKGVGVAGK